MSEEFKLIEADFKTFSQKFEESAMTLIAKMAEITEKLDRVTASVEMIDKLKVQNSENKQEMTQVKNGVQSMLRRLEKMAKDGFVIPDSPPLGETSLIGASALNVSYSGSKKEAVDDLSDLGDLPDMDDLKKQYGLEGASSSSKAPVPPKLGAAKPESKKPEVQKQEAQKPEIQKPISPQKEHVQHVQSASGIPKSDMTRIDNASTPKDILQNLVKDLEDANLESHVGTLVIQAKDKIAKLVPFHTTYFEMIMFGGKYKASTKTNTAELVAEVKKKIEEWKSKF
jgi:hypothetical protein